MALALRPAVALIALASILFLLAGALDGFYGAPAYATMESYVFGVVNLVVAALIARGNERILALRIGLAAFFVVERPVTAVAFGAAPLDSVAVHLVTAVVEAVVLVSTLRVWRLGHSVSAGDLSLLGLSSAPARGVAAHPGAVPTAPAPHAADRTAGGGPGSPAGAG